jgi:hypothetical protein
MPANVPSLTVNVHQPMSVAARFTASSMGAFHAHATSAAVPRRLSRRHHHKPAAIAIGA